MKTKLLILFPIVLLTFLAPTIAFAQSNWSILPSAGNETVESCREILHKNEQEKEPKYGNKILGCAIKTGEVHMYMLPYFITYIIKLLLTVAGLISVLFMVYGGYQWVVAGISEKQEGAKKTIWHALIGFVVVLISFAVVSIVQTLATG